MGSQQVLRAAALVAVTAVSAAAFAQPAAPTSAAPTSAAPTAAAPVGLGAPVVVVDLTGEAGGERAAQLRQELRGAGFAVLSAPDLDAVNSGVDGGKDLGESLASLELARSAFGALDCPGAAQAAETAIATLAARAAAGVEVTAELTTAWSYLLLCRDRSGDFDGAMRAAQALRQLAPGSGGAAAPGPNGAIPDAVWSKYPAVDATANRDIAELTVIADPGATVMIDHRPAGTSPAQVFLPAGRHVVAAAQGSRRAAVWVDVTTARASVALRLFEQDAPLSRLGERVAAWKLQPPAGSQIATYLENLLTAAQCQPWNPSSARSPLLILLDARGARLWASDGPGQEPTATEIATGPAAPAAEQTAQIITALRARTLLWREPSPEPDRLLVEPRDEVAREEPRRATQWWVYAAIAGAVAVGGAVILANELSEDTQRVELRLP
jgi:hypothetical protein